MANAKALRLIWEKTDSSYIQAVKYERKIPVSRRLFPQTSSEGNRPLKNLNLKDGECENASERISNHNPLGKFDAIPEEFRPIGQGEDLMKIRTSPLKEGSNEKMRTGEPNQDESFPNEPYLSPRDGNTRNSNSSIIQSNTRDYKKELLKREQRQRDKNVIFDETGKQKKSNEMFFSSQNESTSNTSNGCQRNWSESDSNLEPPEKSKLKNAQDQNPYRIFNDSVNNQSKATREFDGQSSFEKNKKENFNKYEKIMPPKFQDGNANNQNRDTNEVNFPKFHKNTPFTFQDRNGSDQSKQSLADKGAQKITEVTVEKRIRWRNDLCKFKKPENKPNYFYKYTKTTKESVSYVPSNSEDDEGTKKDFKKNTFIINYEPFKQRSVNQNDKCSNSTGKRKQAEHFIPVGPQKSVNKLVEEHSCFQCGNDKDPIIVKHEIKIIHMNEQGKDSHRYKRTVHNASQASYKGRSRIISNNLVSADIRERNGRTINTDSRENFGVKIEENTITKTTGCFQGTRKNYLRTPLKLPGSSSKTKNVSSNASRTSNGENGTALIRYGRDISDAIAGSYVAISTFLYNYEQWKAHRRVTMLLFEEVEKNLSQSCYRSKRIAEVAELVGVGCKMVKHVPHVGASVAATVIAFLSDVVSRIFSSSNSVKSIGMEDFQLKLSLQRDTDATSDIYMYGMQCDLNFHETCQLIEEFHSEIQNGRFKEFEETFEIGFLKEMSLLNPKHPAVFYKKLERFYKLLHEHQVSEESKAFCGAFEDWPNALTIISRLHRRFKTEKWDSSSVMKEWKEVYNLLQNNQSAVKDVLKKIQDCICVLIREQSIMEAYAMDLQRQC